MMVNGDDEAIKFKIDRRRQLREWGLGQSEMSGGGFQIPLA